MTRTSILLTALMLSACEPALMTSSGAAYLQKSPIDDPKLAAFANYEPDLQLPARIGVLRYVHGRISPMPEAEMELLSKDLPYGLGTFVPLTELEARSVASKYTHGDTDFFRALGASRHLDQMLVLDYNPYTNSAQALLIDVSSGYPYASIAAQPPGRGIRTFWGGWVTQPERLNRATLRLARHLKPDLDEMAARLIAQARR